MKHISESFGNELIAAGLGNVSVSWGADGTVDFHPDVSQAERDAVLAVLADHDPDAPIVILRENMIVTRFQAHAAIARAGQYEAVVALMDAPETPFETRLAWNEAQEFTRTSPTVQSMGAVLGLSETQLDDLFILAATIKA
jgi:hypothetical protein